MKVFMSFLIMVFAMMLVPTHVSASDRNAQMMRERNVPPSVLADRVEACLRTDPSGTNCKPEGSNATPAQYVESINANPEGKALVAGVADLPRFLRGLKSGPFNGEQCLSGMNESGVAAYCRNLRAPHSGEVAWWHNGTFVLAGDCLNARVGYKPTELPKVEVTGHRYEPTIREGTDPFANRRQVVSQGCTLGNDRWFGVMVFEAKAAEHQCAVRTMLPFGGRMGERQGGGVAGTYHDPDRFSRTCGTPLRNEVKAGQLALSTTPHRFEVFVSNGSREEIIFTGTVTGNMITATTNKGLLHESGKILYLPEEYTSGDLVVRYSDPNGLRTPTATGTGERVENIRRGCKVGAFYAIDADGSTAGRQVARQGD